MSLDVQKELLALKGSAELLKVDDVVEWARANKQSALHKQYNWDIPQAAYEHWRETTRRLIALHVTYSSGERRLVSLSIDRVVSGGGYRDREDIIAAPDLLEVMQDDALRELERFKAKYAMIAALKPVFTAVDQVLDARDKKKGRKRKGDENRPSA